MPRLTFSARKLSSFISQKTGAMVIPVFTDHSPNAQISALDTALGGSIQRTLTLGDFTGKLGTHANLLGIRGIKRVILVGCGSRVEFDRAAQRKFAQTSASVLAKSAATDATVDISDLAVDETGAANVCEDIGHYITTETYVYTETITRQKAQPALKKVVISCGSTITAARARTSLAIGQAIGEGANFTRELVNLPGNICTPTYLSKQARALGRRYTTIKTTVLGEKKMAELGMGSLLSVGNGSDQESQLIVMEYSGGKAKQAPYALVGKGITFDTGGISLKPGPNMDTMKFDMGGAGAVFGTMQAVAELGLPINVVGVVAAAENMPSGRATKPGDVVKSMSGKTIEILNTDAEGRLVLCDALTYVGRYKPVEVVDIATLTGAIIVALGSHATGVFANNDDLARDLLDAGQSANDRGWQMPVWEDYQSQLDSPFADVANIGKGGGNAGSVTAACFLARFAEDYKWAHLDVAGTAFSSSPKGATGRPVPMLVRYLRNRAGK